MKKLLILLLFCYSSFSQNVELGFGMGTNWYKGELQDWVFAPNLTQLKDASPNFNFYYGFQKSDRLIYRASLDIGTIKKQNSLVYSPVAFNDTTFRTFVFNIKPSIDYLFFDYSDNKKDFNWSPFASAGLNIVSLIRNDNPSLNFGFNYGVGAMMEFNQIWGIRAQIISNYLFYNKLEGDINYTPPGTYLINNLNTPTNDRYIQFQLFVTYKIHKIFCPRESR